MPFFYLSSIYYQWSNRNRGVLEFIDPKFVFTQVLWLWTEEDQILHREQLRQVQDEHATSTQTQTRTRPVLLTTAPTCHLRCCVVKHLKYLDFNILMRALLLIIIMQCSVSQTMVADLYCTSKNSVTRNAFKWCCNSYRNLQKKRPYRKQQQ